MEASSKEKKKTKKSLEESKKQEAENAVRDAVVEKATANAEIVIPEVMVENELDQMMKEFEQRLQMQGMNLELYFQFSGQDEAALKGQMKEDAEKRVRMNLVLDAIVKAENINVTDEEVDAEIAKMAEMYKMEVDHIKAALGSLEGIKADMNIRKAVDFLVENSKQA